VGFDHSHVPKQCWANPKSTGQAACTHTKLCLSRIFSMLVRVGLVCIPREVVYASGVECWWIPSNFQRVPRRLALLDVHTLPRLRSTSVQRVQKIYCCLQHVLGWIRTIVSHTLTLARLHDSCECAALLHGDFSMYEPRSTLSWILNPILEKRTAQPLW
jgi:hypothetical protein